MSSFTSGLYFCPKCKGNHVQQFMAYWENPNTGEKETYYGIAELYPETAWCNDCQEHTGPLLLTLELQVTP